MKALLILAAAFALTACGATTGTLTPGAPIVSTQPTLADERALFAAEAAYNVAANAYLSADSRGQLAPAVKVSAKAGLERAYAALVLARRARDVGEAATLVEQAALALRLATDVRNSIPR